MTGLGTVQMLLVAAAMFCAVTGVVGSFATSFVLNATGTWAPANRHRALVLFGLAPLLLGLTAVVSVMLPSLLGLHWPAHDHCLVHGGHSHLCFVHASHGWGSPLGWCVLAAGFAVVAVRALHAGRALLVASDLIAKISHSARHDAQHGALRVPSQDMFCLSAGLLRPRLFVSEGLLAASTADELEVMLTHERAHVRRRDSLVRLVVRTASALLLPRARQDLLAGIELSAEQACDDEAGQRTGDRVRVAETILAVERRLQSSTALSYAPLVANFGSTSVPERIEAMLQPRREAGGRGVAWALLAVAIGAVLGAHDILHHSTESLLGFLSH